MFRVLNRTMNPKRCTWQSAYTGSPQTKHGYRLRKNYERNRAKELADMGEVQMRVLHIVDSLRAIATKTKKEIAMRTNITCESLFQRCEHKGNWH
jgi:hypothetical protein